MKQHTYSDLYYKIYKSVIILNVYILNDLKLFAGKWIKPSGLKDSSKDWYRFKIKISQFLGTAL